MDFPTVDYLTGIGKKRFIAELMPSNSHLRQSAEQRGARRHRQDPRKDPAGPQDAG